MARQLADTGRGWLVHGCHRGGRSSLAAPYLAGWWPSGQQTLHRRPPDWADSPTAVLAVLPFSPPIRRKKAAAAAGSAAGRQRKGTVPSLWSEIHS